MLTEMIYIFKIHQIRTVLLALLLASVLIACEKTEKPANYDNPGLIGSWVTPQFTDIYVTYTRANNLLENQYGYTFLPDNKLIERQNSGFCGTPPITTVDNEGTWNRNDSLIDINVKFIGGSADHTWRIVELTPYELVITVVKSEYHEGK